MQSINKLISLLEKEYGISINDKKSDPLDQLIQTVLSQNTTDLNRDRAYCSLKSKFSDWDDLINSTDGEVARAIAPAGLNYQKARRIRQILKRIRTERGMLTLDFLEDMPDSHVEKYLLSFSGVGLKTAKCVMLFSLKRNAFPVDTHIMRVCKRLGLIDDRDSAETAHQKVKAIFPPEKYFSLHLNLIRHGRIVCKARNPQCDRCVLLKYCKKNR